jgi:hypothetical protein
MLPSSGEGKKIPTLLGPLERANFNHTILLGQVIEVISF